MPVSLTAVQTAAENPKRKTSRVGVTTAIPHYLTGAELAAEVVSAIRATPAARRVACGARGDLTPEGEALAQNVVLSLLSGRDARRGTPAQVLAYIGWCERFPTLAARSGDTGVPRDRAGRKFLVLRVLSVMAQKNDWTDTASRYRTRAQSRRGDRSMIEPMPDLTGDDAPVGTLARSLPVDPFRVDSLDVPDLARAVGEALAPDNATHARRIAARLIQAAAVADQRDAAVVLADLAADQGRTLSAVRMDADRGADLLAAVDPGDLLALLRDHARAQGALHRTWDRLDLTADQRRASDLIAAVARTGGAWDPASIRTERHMPEWADTEVAPDLAPLPAASRPGVGAMPVRPARYRAVGPAVPVLPTSPRTAPTDADAAAPADHLHLARETRGCWHSERVESKVMGVTFRYVRRTPAVPLTEYLRVAFSALDAS